MLLVRDFRSVVSTPETRMARLFFALFGLSLVHHGSVAVSIDDYGAVPGVATLDAAWRNTAALKVRGSGPPSSREKARPEASRRFFSLSPLSPPLKPLPSPAQTAPSQAAFARVAVSNASLGSAREVLVPRESSYRILSTDLGLACSHVTFRILGALEMHDDFSAWSSHRPSNAGLYFHRCENLTITGEDVGVIDGRGLAWWAQALENAVTLPPGSWVDARPNALEVVNSTDVVVERLRLVNAPAFHLRTDNVLRQTIRRVVVRVDEERQRALRREAFRASRRRGVQKTGASPPRRKALLPAGRVNEHAAPGPSLYRAIAAARERKPTPHSFAGYLSGFIPGVLADRLRRDVLEDLAFPLNTDGIDVGGEDVLVQDCDVANFDDAVAVKPSRGGPDASADNPVRAACTRDVLVERLLVRNSLGASVGSVSPHRHVECVRNVTFRDVHMETPFKAIYVKTERDRSDDAPNARKNKRGIIADVLYENVTAIRPRWLAMYLGPQQMVRPDERFAGLACMLDPLRCETEPAVAVANITLRDVAIRGGPWWAPTMGPSVLNCHPEAACEGVELTRVTRDGWPFGAGDFFGERGWAYVCRNVRGTTAGSDPEPECLRAERGRTSDGARGR
jgi:hypothetical protein